ncbi:MAG: DUF2182 domain-containing protein, partial [Sphingomonadaceae bacterium]
MLQRDRAIVSGALIVVTLLAWAYVARLATTISMPDMGPMLAMRAPPWTAGRFLLTLVMWAVMMIGMMTPSAAAMILLYARVGRHALAQGRPLAATGWFAAGYLLAWSGFALFATIAQWALERAALLSPMMASASPLLGGALLVAAGVYQWTPLKYACLSQCQSPMMFIQRHGGFRPEWSRALLLGLRHGAYCIGCCWALMLLLFVGGVMNLAWIGGLALLVLAEKLAPARLPVTLTAAGVLI